jgi:predicted ABC-class ATPase
MQQLVKKEHEPITAFVDKVRLLYRQHGISTVLVLGGSGDYLGVADRVIQMIEYEPSDVTERAQDIVRDDPSKRDDEGDKGIELPRGRCPLRDGLDTRNEHGHRRVYSPNPHELVYGRMRVDLNDVEQLLDSAQTKAIGLAIEHARQRFDGDTSLDKLTGQLLAEIGEAGLDVIDPRCTGDLAEFRGFEFAAVLNRMRDLQVIQLP